MLNVRPVWVIAVHLAFAVMSMLVTFCAVLLPHEMSWMRSGTKLSQFLRVFHPTPTRVVISYEIYETSFLRVS